MKNQSECAWLTCALIAVTTVGGCKSDDLSTPLVDSDVAVDSIDSIENQLSGIGTIEFRIEVTQSEPGFETADAFVFEGMELKLSEARTFQLKNAYFTQDRLGYAAVGFELIDEERTAFSSYTASHQNHRMALMMGDKVISLAKIRGPLSGAVIIEGEFTPEEVDEIVGFLRESGSGSSSSGGN